MKALLKISLVLTLLFLYLPLYSQINIAEFTEGHYISPGIETSITLSGKPLFGGELSYSYFFENLFYCGAFINPSYDFDLKTLKTIIGTQFGYTIIGLDIGLLVNSRNSNNRIGFIIKPQVNIPFTLQGFGKNGIFFPFLSIYYGFNYVDNKYEYSEFGIMIKFPVRFYQ